MNNSVTDDSEIENSVSCRQSIAHYLELFVKSLKGRGGMQANVINSSAAVMSLLQSFLKKNNYDLEGTVYTIHQAAVSIAVFILLVNYSSRFNLAMQTRSQFINQCVELDQIRDQLQRFFSYRGDLPFFQLQLPQENSEVSLRDYHPGYFDLKLNTCKLTALAVCMMLEYQLWALFDNDSGCTTRNLSAFTLMLFLNLVVFVRALNFAEDLDLLRMPLDTRFIRHFNDNARMENISDSVERVMSIPSQLRFWRPAQSSRPGPAPRIEIAEFTDVEPLIPSP
jgi:hypothetical protein